MKRTRPAPAGAWLRVACGLLLLGLVACGSRPGTANESPDGAGGESSAAPALPYARSVEAFEPGDGAGFNQDRMPDIVLGPPLVKEDGVPSLDVVSLGAGGSIVLGFGTTAIVDGPGPDFVVFENPFWPGGDPSQVYAELGEVAVSEDGEHWQSFACDTAGDGAGHFPGCAGVTPTLVYDSAVLVPLDPAQTGGDAFDLKDLGVSRARYVRIVDLKTLPVSGVSSGFDLDAVGVVNQASD